MASEAIKQIKHRGQNAPFTPLARKLSASTQLSENEVGYLEALQGKTSEFPKGTQFIHDGEPLKQAYIVQSGWAIRYTLLSSGRRQIWGYILPGDAIGFHVNFQRSASFSVSTLTHVVLSQVDPDQILQLYRDQPVLAAGLSWCAAREYTLLGDQSARIGRLSAADRLAHLFLELWHRLELIGETEGAWLELPMTQADLADTLGLSLVHLNRELGKMRKRGLVTITKTGIRLNHFDQLMEMSEFNPGHLEGFRL